MIADLDAGCRANQEEIFGPVVTVTPFEREDELLAMVNGVKYGLSASLWTPNSRMRAFSESKAHTLFRLQLVSSVCTTNEFASKVQRISNSFCQ